MDGNRRLAAVALTGHLCDVTMGMVLIPVSRHSALASFFKLSVSTTLTFHMLTAYTLFTLVLIHGFLYVSWVAVFNSLSERLRPAFPVLNPTYLYFETWPGNLSALGIWRASLVFTGVASTTIMGLIFVTTLPKIRAKHVNLFYYTHLLSILAIIIICLHASTVFYCVAPGLAMWVLDWGMRLYELRNCVPGKVVHLGKGWYCIDMLLPRERIDGCACKSPVAHFYIRHSMTSARELHPFTTITPLASQKNITSQSRDDMPIQFLFRKRGNPDSFPGPQWTDKLAGLADKCKPLSGHGPNSSSSSSQRFSTPLIEPVNKSLGVEISLRLEGPYFSEADPTPYRTVICLSPVLA
ncbi:hypothetical protein N7520_008830 [Penicillium odoratum]|uniref:uncharacterized protein n=1 Tax=Penicillium odoratum TaxID=1167516 RepID=UPI00254821D2|nr:uncharacterized protein N7520_008830 [Penicillium odoratum]KAJ5751913.1 hypothetical protein N7520_008830 [Penicillium odoratum]